MGGSERVQLSGVYNVRKGKLALPVNRWSKRQVTLSGTCLIVSSVKHAHTGKMHILPLIGGKVIWDLFNWKTSSLTGYRLDAINLQVCAAVKLCGYKDAPKILLHGV